MEDYVDSDRTFALPAYEDLVEAAEWRTHLWAPVVGEAVSLAALGGWSGISVLELGYGGGRFAGLLAKMGAHVTGIEITDRTQQRARDYVEGLGLSDRCEFVVGDFFKMDQDFDRVVTKSVLYSIPDLEEYERWLQRIHELLAPGGDVLFIENGSGHPLVRIFRRYLHRYRRYADFVLSDPRLPALFAKYFDDVEIRSFYSLAPLIPWRGVAAIERRRDVSFEKCFIFIVHARKRS